MPATGNDEFDRWIAATEQRQFAELTFPEVSRALRALSSAYVERRGRLREGAALSGAGKRAAFALFYGPLHFLLVQHIAASLDAATRGFTTLVDLGCGTGAAGAALASACARPPAIVGIDRNPWAIQEAKATYHAFGLSARVRSGDAAAAELPSGSCALAAFALNEIDAAGRQRMLVRLLDHAERGGRFLIVEPLAGFVAPWWRDWERQVRNAGGRSDEWRVRAELPAIVAKLDRAAGLDHREITGRSLFAGPT